MTAAACMKLIEKDKVTIMMGGFTIAKTCTEQKIVFKGGIKDGRPNKIR
jgi:hypothetical protein